MSYRAQHSATGAIEIPQGSIMLQGGVRGYLDVVNNAVRALDRDIGERRSAIESHGGAGFLREWDVFKQQWATWFAANSSLWAASWGSTVDEANTYAARYNAYERRYTELTGARPSNPGTIGNAAGSYVPWLIGGSIVIGLLGVGYVVSGVAKIYQAKAVSRSLSLVRNRRRRRKS